MHRIGSWLAIAILLGIPAAGIAQDRYFVSDGVRIRYIDQGAGDPVVHLRSRSDHLVSPAAAARVTVPTLGIVGTGTA